jgi:hypothetical protein
MAAARNPCRGRDENGRVFYFWGVCVLRLRVCTVRSSRHFVAAAMEQTDDDGDDGGSNTIS